MHFHLNFKKYDMVNLIDKSYWSLLQKRFCSSHISVKKEQNRKQYKNTVFLPKTEFPSFLKPKEVYERHRKIQKECQFLEFYTWQRQHLKGKEFVLHDGPPYANGKPHIGHAINKILKDIILRSQAIQGCKLHFMPGWDCHGLPIELIAIRDSKGSLKPTEVRKKARDLALEMSTVQMEGFKEWGIIGDWNNKCYYTSDAKYVVNQLKIFWKLYEKGLIYYDLKPVFWSPSSQTALAESELSYNDITSDALTVRFVTTECANTDPLYLLVWTTTPWTLPLNAAVYFSSQIKYSLIEIEGLNGKYVIAQDLVEAFKQKTQRNISVISDISTETLKKLKYKHPWYSEKVLKVFESSYVKLSGTGLLHSVPGHGHEDFLMGLANNLKVECFVDEKGCYMPNAGKDLSGLNVLGEGSKAVIEHLSSEIILQEQFVHSYPHDWRTNGPVIIRASNQWFIDTEELKGKAIENLKGVHIPLQYFVDRIKKRPYWCLSRQRTWGVPIPSFFHKHSRRPLLTRDLVYHLCHLIESRGTDVWWTMKVKDLFPESACRDLFVRKEDVVKGEDIMDIWFDSGVSWSYALEGKKSDIYVEGNDQYGGWFHSSLLTSVGAGNGAPFKRILTHGFAVDENGRKMSKSLGNVVDPEIVIKGDKAFGVDVLRWWVGFHSQNMLIPVSTNTLKSNSEGVQKLRSIFRFLLGALQDVTEDELFNENQSFQTLDIFLLNSCYQFYNSVLESYNAYNVCKVLRQTLYFTSNVVSSKYITIIKDRLYCDERHSARRKACQFVLNEIFHTLSRAVAPVLPHLAEEVFMYHPVYGQKGEKIFFASKPWKPSEWWKNDSADEIINLLDELRKIILLETKNPQQMSCIVEVEESDHTLLMELQNGNTKSIDSEITEILQVAEITLKLGNCKKINLSPATANECNRCRRHTAFGGNQLCERCEEIVSNLS